MSKYNDNLNDLNRILIKYQFADSDKAIFQEIIKPIFNHYEFQKRMSSPYYHHAKVTLGYHLLSDAAVTYKLSQKLILRLRKKYHIVTPEFPKEIYDLTIAVRIALLHDFYTNPWQNRLLKNKFFNRHGFRHPLEAAINTIIIYKRFFPNEEELTKVIDGIIHHMYPFPVRIMDNSQLELNNLQRLSRIPNKYKSLIINSSNRHKIFSISFSRSLYLEGRVVGKADKIVSIKNELKDISSLVACLTGKNKKLNN